MIISTVIYYYFSIFWPILHGNPQSMFFFSKTQSSHKFDINKSVGASQYLGHENKANHTSFNYTYIDMYISYYNICPTRCNFAQFILSGNCSTCFGWYHHPSSGAQTTVSTASGICHTVTATCRYSVR